MRVGDPAGDLAAAAGPRLTMESFGFGWQSGSLIPSPVQRQHPWGLVVAGNAVRPRHYSPQGGRRQVLATTYMTWVLELVTDAAMIDMLYSSKTSLVLATVASCG